MMVCATDNPDPDTGYPCRIARPSPYRTIAAVQCNGRFWGGDLVLASGGGYWTAYTQEGAINLVHFTEAGPDQTIDNAGSAGGATVGAQFGIDVPDHNYHAFKAYPDGSVAYPAAGTNNTSIRIARLMPCQ